MILALIHWLVRLFTPTQPLRAPVIIERRIRR